MLQIINGKEYNTFDSTHMGTWESGEDTEMLWRDLTGTYFITAADKIVPVSQNTARTWAANRGVSVDWDTAKTAESQRAKAALVPDEFE